MKLVLSIGAAATLMSGSLPTCGNIANATEAYQRGCCSHHGGVCGCRGGRKVCCDKTFSPTCTC